jgi:CHAT domain-containing protein
LEELRVADKASEAGQRLAVLWQTLVPEPEREAIVEGKVSRLVVVPDGPLALLPLETLIVRSGASPQYLLDVGPPIQYGPSATVLYNLAQRRLAAEPPAREAILTVGNPSYRRSPPVAAPQATSALDALATMSRYRSAGGELRELPYSGWESSWVAGVFGQSDVASLKIVADEATEARVRRQVAGRRVIHFACHGLADQSHGNFFGALALAPGPDRTDPHNDGFLTLAEIYELDLKGTELTILSACETNYGPEQKGEGVWALSRGFLVAGSRRVVASNWLVDDEAAANLVSVFCTFVARAEKEGGTVDYAEALQKAKRWVRNQEKWSSPYYWGTFVLVGPN